MTWFCCTNDGYGSREVPTAGDVEYFVEEMLDEGYELSDIFIFNMADRQELKAVSRPSFEFLPGRKAKK